MFLKRTLSIGAAIGLAAIMPAAASASQTAFRNTPVSFSACAANTSITPATSYDLPRTSSDLHYRFVNDATVNARSVTFDIVTDDATIPVVETGNFSPGVSIDRNVDQPGKAFDANVIGCRVTEVDFQDGTSWHAANQSVAARR